MATFWERATHSVYNSYVLFVIAHLYFGCFQFRFQGRESGSDCARSWSLLSVYLTHVTDNRFKGIIPTTRTAIISNFDRSTDIIYMQN